jgi:hypothetical protein
MAEEHTTSGVAAESKVRKNITVPEDLFDAFMDLKREGETQGGLMRRVIEAMHSIDSIVSANAELMETHETLVLEHAEIVGNVEALKEELEDLHSGSTTAVIPGQTTFSLKDAIASLKDVCDDDAVCIKFAAKVVEEQAKAMSKHLDREHSAEQKRLDREDKDKDRALKKDLAESRAEHDKDIRLPGAEEHDTG